MSQLLNEVIANTEDDGAPRPANLFVFLDAHRPWRKVEGTEQRTAHDFAGACVYSVDLHYPKADLFRAVLDNLSTHSPGRFTSPFPHPSHTAFCDAWSSITLPKALPGWTWSRSRSVSCDRYGNRRRGRSA
jgi:hypothetical protein